MASPTAAEPVLQPRSSASMDHRQQPTLPSYTTPTPMPSWPPPQCSLASSAVSPHSPSCDWFLSPFFHVSNVSVPPGLQSLQWKSSIHASPTFLPPAARSKRGSETWDVQRPDPQRRAPLTGRFQLLLIKMLIQKERNLDEFLCSFTSVVIWPHVPPVSLRVS